MTGFRQRRRIDKFWRWWADNRQQVLLAIDEGPKSVVNLLGPAVSRLGNHVEWELGPGVSKANQLVVSPGGVRDVLPFTLAWVGAAPEDPDVEFLPARRRTPSGADGTVERNGRKVDLGRTRFTLASPRDADWLDVRLHHPDFGGMTEQERYEFGFRALDMELGEFAVMTRLGMIDVSPDTPDAALPLADLYSLLKSAD